MIMQELYWAISARRHKPPWELAWKLFRWLNRGKTFRCFNPEWVRSALIWTLKLGRSENWGEI